MAKAMGRETEPSAGLEELIYSLDGCRMQIATAVLLGRRLRARQSQGPVNALRHKLPGGVMPLYRALTRFQVHLRGDS